MYLHIFVNPNLTLLTDRNNVKKIQSEAGQLASAAVHVLAVVPETSIGVGAPSPAAEGGPGGIRSPRDLDPGVP